MKDIQELLDIEIEDLLQSQYGPLSFKSEESKILFIREILEHLNNVDPILFQSKSNAMSIFIYKIKTLFNGLKNYKGTYRENQIQSLNEIVTNIPTEVHSVIGMSLAIKNKNLSDKTIKNKIKELDAIIDKMNVRERESEDILKSMKANMGTTGIADYANIFQEESNTHKINSRIWLGSIVLLVVIIIAIALGVLIGDIVPKDEKTATLVQFTFSKLIIFSSLFFLLTLAFKSYKSSKHNEILNKHRQNAITTFEKFVKSANDDRTKNAVLLQTVDAIFSQQNTGYNDNDSDAVSPQTKILEIINSSTKND